MNEQWGVSIIVVNFNYERFLAAAIDSALGQGHGLCEVIVVDDCSTDNSRAIIAQYGNRIQSVLQQTNGGQIVAMNRAWPMARYPIFDFPRRRRHPFSQCCGDSGKRLDGEDDKSAISSRNHRRSGAAARPCVTEISKGTEHGDDTGSAPEHW